MSAKKQQNHPPHRMEQPVSRPFWTRSWFDDTLAILSGLAFLAVCYLLPLVGRAGVETPYAGKNRAAFLVALLITLALAGAALAFKLLRRKLDQGGWPIWTGLLTGTCLILLLAQLAGLLKI